MIINSIASLSRSLVELRLEMEKHLTKK